MCIIQKSKIGFFYSFDIAGEDRKIGIVVLSPKLEIEEKTDFGFLPHPLSKWRRERTFIYLSAPLRSRLSWQEAFVKKQVRTPHIPDLTREYIVGQDRNDPDATTHLYETPPGERMNPLGPMCRFGWNRMGVRFSILRNIQSGRDCVTCKKRAAQHLGYVEPKRRETRWI